MNNSLSEKYPEIAKQWPERNAPLGPVQVPYDSNRIVWRKDICSHEWDKRKS